MPRRQLKVGISSGGQQKPIVISERDWQRIELAYGGPIGQEARDQIRQVTQEFAVEAISEAEAAPLVDARKAVEEYRSAGQALLTTLQRHPTGVDGRFYALFLIRNYLHDERLGAYLPYLDPLGALAGVLNSFITACEKSLKELSDPNRAEFQEGAAWKAWIRQLTAIAERNGLPTPARKDSDKQKDFNPSPFVALVRELQRCVPSACFTQRSDPTLATAIAAARTASGE